MLTPQESRKLQGDLNVLQSLFVDMAFKG